MAPTIAEIRKYVPLFEAVKNLKEAVKVYSETKKLPMGGRVNLLKDNLRTVANQYQEEFKNYLENTSTLDSNVLYQLAYKLFKNSEEGNNLVYSIAREEDAKKHFKKKIIENITSDKELKGIEANLRTSNKEGMDFEDIDPIKILENL